ncbi:MAG: hypothetical protein FD143_2377 [Ignavibacteria bacterium]|nr:MAG: hypothetical protein FD143_2377 [Ignavibacteria bacterium]KAF0157603.1 MAG: hypothetical protein FD188_2702 [Ignavibacteria bacterium]
MIVDLKKIHKLLNAAADESISHSQLTELVKISRLVIQSYLATYRSNVINLINRNGITITDLAYDCIADVFSRCKELKFYKINQFANSLKDNVVLIEPVNLFLAYKSYLIKIANAQISKLYAQTDPVGAKILRNIKDSVHQSNKLRITKDLRGLKIEVTNNGEENNKPDFPINQFILNGERNKRILNASDFIEQIYNNLQNQTEYKKSVYLFDIIILFKNYFGSEFVYNFEICEDTFISKINGNCFEEYEIQNLKQKVELFIKEKIMVNYFLKGKLNKIEAEAIFFSVNDIINDWCTGNISSSSIYEYLRNHFDVSQDLYLKNYRTKIEYLLKLARDEFADYMIKEL